MDLPPPSMRDLAGRLLAANRTTFDPHAPQAVWVFETLRTSLSRFAGADGFAALLRRALILASAQAPSLRSVSLGPGGHLQGLDGVPADAAVELAAYLLGLLVTCVGEPLTLVLVSEALPDASPGNSQ
jgi:hypothetical protein